MRWNLIRTLASIAALLCLVRALIVHARPAAGIAPSRTVRAGRPPLSHLETPDG